MRRWKVVGGGGGVEGGSWPTVAGGLSPLMGY